MTQQHNHGQMAALNKHTGSANHADLELQITNYFMGSTCPHIEHHVGATPGVHNVSLNRASGIIQVGYNPARTTPEAIIEAVKHCGFMCREGGPVHKAGHIHPEHTAPAEHEDHAGHDAHAGHGAHMAAVMRNRFLVSAVITLIIIVYSPLGTRLLALNPPVPLGMSVELFQFLLTTPVVFWGAWPFLSVAWTALLRGQLNMATLIATGILTAFLYSVGATFVFEGDVFYEAAAMLTTFSLLGHWMEMAARNATGEAITSLLKLVP
ncbi:MAG: cation transporter, partial [Anaerolineae bacterium]